MQVVQRAEWGARPPRSRTPLTGSLGLALHYNGPAMAITAHSQCAGRVRQTQAFHMDPPPNGRGWVDVAYSFLICPHGVIYVGRGWGTRTAANGTNAGNNSYHAAMVLIGGSQPLSDAAKRAFLWLLGEHRRIFGRGVARYHAWFKPTDCAGPHGNAWIRAGAPAPAGSVAPPPAPAPSTPPPATRKRAFPMIFELRGHDKKSFSPKRHASVPGDGFWYLIPLGGGKHGSDQNFYEVAATFLHGSPDTSKLAPWPAILPPRLRNVAPGGMKLLDRPDQPAKAQWTP